MPTQTPDVLVIGGGIAALCAAIAARRDGAAVRLAELAPAPMRGGNARHARNLRLMHPAPTPFSPSRYTAAEYLAELQRAAAGLGDPALQRLFVDRTAELQPWLAAQGVHFQPAGDGLLPPSRRTAFLLGGGKAMMNALYATATRLGVAIGCDTRAAPPTLACGTATHVDLHTPSGPQRLHPRAVVLCGGGAQADLAALRPYWGEADFIVRGVPYADGALLRGLLAQGAAPSGQAGACHLVAVDARSPPCDGGIVTRIPGISAGIVVNRAARRFHDEGADAAQTRYAAWGRQVAGQPGQIAWLVLDAEAEQRIRPPLFPPLRAATPELLATRLGLDPAVFAATLAEFNAAVRAGGHTEGLLPPKTRHAHALTTPPFAALPIRPGITFTSQGVAVDAQARVVMSDSSRIKNLFAAGTIMAPCILGTGYLAGAAMAVAAVFGRIAGSEAARHASR